MEDYHPRLDPMLHFGVANSCVIGGDGQIAGTQEAGAVANRDSIDGGYGGLAQAIYALDQRLAAKCTLPDLSGIVDASARELCAARRGPSRLKMRPRSP